MKMFSKKNIFFLCILSILFVQCRQLHENHAQNIAIFTDYEADDSVALALFLKHAKENTQKQNLLIGSLLSNQYRKQALVQELVTLFGFDPQCVHAGTGGIKEPFEEEGRNILPAGVLNHFAQLDKVYLNNSDPAAHHDSALKFHFTTMLEKAAPQSVDVLLLTNPIDFVRAFEHKKELLHKVKSIYMMGGWGPNQKLTFNWNLHVESVKELLELMQYAKREGMNTQLVLFSSHFFAREFNGYVNPVKFPEVIQAFDGNNHPIINHLRAMVKNWDDSMTVVKEHHNEQERGWRLAMVDRIGKDNIGRQFTPADPATVIGYLYPQKFIIKSTPTDLIIENEVVKTQENSSSNIFVVEKVDIEFFKQKLVALMQICN